ncbi:hypothetical protein M427DRAFT_237728 [Gonapodya prolifera JEL478]|uniref:RNI-like protein n=1 Tax=Gonapodya prolifera (strain JEL478) TaxID=1344416 RepID=A0A139AMN9_GONPJ|nr:hypothetical protein M427DRAFT_237728 [Gonapodya prolifera JEL478]|eukprot:KXS18031.1 hypothetical protein M427DRAFT_237728 [Gonapodya prolifera JEL478]
MAAASSSGQPLPTLSSLDGFDRLLLSQTPISQNDVYALASTFATTADLKMVCLWKCTLDDRAVRVLCGTAFLRGHPGVTCLHIVGCGVRASGALHVARLLADLPDDVGDVEKLWDSSNTTDHGGDTVGHGHPPSHDTTKQRPTHPTTTTLPPLPFANSVSQPRKHASALTRTAPDLVPQPPPTKPPFTSLLTILVLDHNSGLGTVGVSLLFDAIRLTSMPKPAPSPSPAPSPDDAPSAPAPSADPAAPVDPPTSASPRSAKALAGGKPASFGCRLTKVSIRYCDAGEDAAGAIGRALEINTTIVDLDLTGNSLSNAGVLHIAPYLSRNTALQKLNLSSNLITDAIPTAEALLKLPRFPAPFDYAEALRYHAARREEGGGSTGGGGAGAGQDASGDSAGATTEPTDPSPPVLLSPLESLACAITAPVNPSSALSYLDLRSNDVGDHGGQVVMNLLKARKGKVQVKVGERMVGVVGERRGLE